MNGYSLVKRTNCMLLGRMLRVCGYEPKLLAASREGAKAGQPGRAHAIVPADGMQGGALMDNLRSGSQEQVGVRTKSGFVAYSSWWDETIGVQPMIFWKAA